MSEWISVNDRLPEKKGRYAVCVLRGSFSPVTKCANFDPKARPNWDMGGIAVKALTHWMVLPDPPESLCK